MKKIALLLLTLVMVLSMAACSSAEETKDPNGLASNPSGGPAGDPAGSSDPAVTQPTNNPNATDPDHRHKLQMIVTPPTCTDYGYTTRACVCGESYLISESEIGPMHSYDGTGTCTLCGKKAKEGSVGLEYEVGYNGRNKERYYTVTGIGSCRDIDIVIPDFYEGLPVREIGFGAFQLEKNFRSVEIPDSVISIGKFAFNGCTGLTSVEIPGAVTEIPAGAFTACTSLKSVKLPENLEALTSEYDYGSYKGPFQDCTSLTSIVIPDKVTSICRQAFEGCTSLASVSIGDGVTEIDYRAFYGCTGLESITIGSNLSSIAFSAFDHKDYVTGHVQNITFDEIYISDLTAWCRIDFDGLSLCGGANLYLNGQLVTELVIPEDVLDFSSAFDGCESITDVVISDNVASLHDYAFNNCTNLKSVTIGNGVTEIGEEVFAFCGNLTTVTIGDGVTKIGDYAFEGCDNLTTVTIGNGVTSIGFAAFRDCSSLKSIQFKGTVKQWNAITKYIGWDKNTGDYTVYCTDGELKKGE